MTSAVESQGKVHNPPNGLGYWTGKLRFPRGRGRRLHPSERGTHHADTDGAFALPPWCRRTTYLRGRAQDRTRRLRPHRAGARRKKFLSYFERNLPELPLADVEQVSSATERVPSSVRRFFREFALKIDPISTSRRTLYSIDGVAAEERFSTLVRVGLVSSGLKPNLPDIDLSEWKSDYELSDREAVGLAVAEMVERMAVARREDDGEPYQLLIQLAQDYLKEWTRRDGLSVQRFYRHAFTSHGDVRADRPTVPIIGSLFTKENARRLFDVASYGLRKTRHAAAAIYWVVPQAPLWGMAEIANSAANGSIA